LEAVQACIDIISHIEETIGLRKKRNGDRMLAVLHKGTRRKRRMSISPVKSKIHFDINFPHYWIGTIKTKKSIGNLYVDPSFDLPANTPFVSW